MIMGMIIGKNRNDIIKTLLKLGEVVVLAKAEIIYAFKPEFFPHQTTEETMEEIKKQPEAYEYYRAGLIKITEISEAKEGEKVGVCGFDPLSTSGEAEVATPSKPSIAIPDELMERIMSKKSEPMEKPITTTELGKKLLDKLGAKEFLDKVKIGTGSINDQREFDGVKKWEDKKD